MLAISTIPGSSANAKRRNSSEDSNRAIPKQLGSWPQTAARLKASKVGLAPAFWYPLTPAARHLLRVTPETLCMASHRHANLPYARSQAWRPLQHLLSERGLLQRAQRTSNITNASESSATEGVFAFSPCACAMYAHAGLCIAMPFARDCLLTLRGVPLFSGSLKFWPVSPPRSCSLLLPSWPSSSYPPRSCPSWPPPLQRPLLGPPSTDGYRSPGHPPRDNLVLSFMFVCALRLCAPRHRAYTAAPCVPAFRACAAAGRAAPP